MIILSLNISLLIWCTEQLPTLYFCHQFTLHNFFTSWEPLIFPYIISSSLILVTLLLVFWDKVLLCSPDGPKFMPKPLEHNHAWPIIILIILILVSWRRVCGVLVVWNPSPQQLRMLLTFENTHGPSMYPLWINTVQVQSHNTLSLGFWTQDIAHARQHPSLVDPFKIPLSGDSSSNTLDIIQCSSPVWLAAACPAIGYLLNLLVVACGIRHHFKSPPHPCFSCGI